MVRSAQPSRTSLRMVCEDPDLARLPIAFYASLPHYLEHMLPVWREMDPNNKAGFWSDVEHPECLSSEYPVPVKKRRSHGPNVPFLDRNPVVVSSFGDLRRVRECVFRPMIGIEHGCGLMYLGDYPQGQWTSLHIARLQFKHLGLCLNLRLVPNDYVGEWDRKFYSCEVVTVGDSPKMDGWRVGAKVKPNLANPTVCISTHFNRKSPPETRETLSYYEPALSSLVRNFRVLGHAHPKHAIKARHVFDRYGIEYVPDFNEVMQRADLYMSSSSSTLYEFASLDRPVVVLRAPFMRQDVHHGLLFWDYVPGVECWKPEDLLRCVNDALEDKETTQEQRQRAIDFVYPQRDGRSAKRCVEAIEAWQRRC